MEVLQREEALEVAQRIVERSAADETEVVVESTAQRFVRFADSGPTQSADRSRYHVAVRARLASDDGWREARATCDGLAEEGIAGALERSLELARLAPPNPELSALEGPFEGMADLGSGEPDADTLGHGFDAKAAWVKAALARCAEHKLEPAGLAETGAESCALVNSAGRAVFDVHGQASLSLTASAAGFEGGSGFAECLRQRVGEVDSEAVFERAVQKALANREPRPVDPGEYTVLLEPSAVSSILLFASYAGFGAQDVHEGASFLCGRVGKQVFPESLCISDDVGAAEFKGLAFDGEGSRKNRVELVRQGLLTGPVTDADWARKLDVPNTGHSLSKPNTAGPKALNLVVEPGTQSTAELIAGMDRGLVITQFHYSNLIDPKDLLLTGMTRNGTFLVERGEIVGAVKNLRFTESLVNALGNLTGLADTREVAGALFGGAIVTPALRIDGFRFTSSTDF